MSDPSFDALRSKWWYYDVELAPGVIAKGAYPPDLPMLPRLALRGVDLRGAACLDIGSMEGLIPVLMARGGATRVLATDAGAHCAEKMAAVKQAYGVSFDFAQVGLVYDMSRKLGSMGGFDLINLSGVLYHVFSPMHVLASLRPLLKRNGLMIISQNVVNRPGHSLEFNDGGRLQKDANTFWYHSIPMLEYMIRYFNMVPVDCIYFPHSPDYPSAYVEGMELGYMSVVCRAVDEAEAAAADPWAGRSHVQSWEYQSLVDRKMMEAQPRSGIGYDGPRGIAPLPRGLDLLAAAKDLGRHVSKAAHRRDSHGLRLEDQT